MQILSKLFRVMFACYHFRETWGLFRSWLFVGILSWKLNGSDCGTFCFTILVWGRAQALTIMAGDLNMTLLPQDRLSKGVEAGQGPPREKSVFLSLLDSFGLRVIEQPVHTYNHPDFSSRLDRVYVNYSWFQSDVVLPSCHRMPSRFSGQLKSFRYPIRFGIQP